MGRVLKAFLPAAVAAALLVWAPAAQAAWAVADGQGRVSLTDTVHYSGLEPGRAYTATAALVDSSMGAALLDAYGDPVASAVTFVPKGDFGTVEVPISFTLGADRDGVAVSAWESVVTDGVEVLRHPASGEPLVLYLEEPPAPEPQPEPEPKAVEAPAQQVPEVEEGRGTMAQTGSGSGVPLIAAGAAALFAGAALRRRAGAS